MAHCRGLLPAQVYKWRRLAELGVIGRPGASELPSFVAVEIARDGSRAAGTGPGGGADSRGRSAAPAATQEGGLIDIELAGGRRVRVDRDVDAAALQRVLDVLARR